MASNTGNYFKGMRDAKTNSRLPYFEANQLYKLQLDKTYVFETRDKGDAFIAEFTIIDTTGTQKAGSKVSFYQSLVKKDTAFGSIKLLIYAILGLDPNLEKDAAKIEKDVDPNIEEEMQKAITENHMAGAMLKCQTMEKVSKDGKTYTVNNWIPA